MNGHLSLRFERPSSGTGTVMTQSRATLPLQASRPMRLDGSGAVCVTLLNPTGGMLGGDCLTTDVDLGAGAHVVLTTTSASKVYRTDSGPAFHRTNLRLGGDSVLEYLPDHVIPHPGSSLDQSLSVEMGPGSRAIILDAFSVGRVAREERWVFKDLTTELEVCRSGQLICRDRIRVRPESWVPSGLGGMDGAAYAATMLLCADLDHDWTGTADTLSDSFSGGTYCVGAASALAKGGCLVRYYAGSAHCLSQATRALWGIARRTLLGLEPLDLRKG